MRVNKKWVGGVLGTATLLGVGSQARLGIDASF